VKQSNGKMMGRLKLPASEKGIANDVARDIARCCQMVHIAIPKGVFHFVIYYKVVS